MGKYNDVFDNFSVQVSKINFKTALNISLLLCFKDIHLFSDYTVINELDKNIFTAFEQAVIDIEKSISNLDLYVNTFHMEYKKCVDFLDNFYEEENLLYDECVNLCSEVIHLFELIFTKDNKHAFEIMKLCFENKEAFIQKSYDNSDEIIQNLIENIGKIDLLWLDI